MYQKNTLTPVSEYLLLWNRPLTLRDRSHAPGPGHGEYISSGYAKLDPARPLVYYIVLLYRASSLYFRHFFTNFWDFIFGNKHFSTAYSIRIFKPPLILFLDQLIAHSRNMAKQAGDELCHTQVQFGYTD